MAKKKKILYPVLFMVVLTSVYTFALAAINEATIDTIKTLEALDVKRSVLYVLNIENDGSKESVETIYEEKLTAKSLGEEKTYYVFREEGVLLGYAFPYTGKGLWGSISGYIALSPNFDEVLGLDFTAHSETPGLGGRIDEEWFKAQFRNLSVDPSETIVFRPSAGGNVDAITGATSTSFAVRDIINAFISDILAYAEEVKANE